MEEEKALKQLRRTLVPHARPVPNFTNPFLPQKYEINDRQIKKNQYHHMFASISQSLSKNVFIFIISWTGHLK